MKGYLFEAADSATCTQFAMDMGCDPSDFMCP
jgi:hypothetical protein